MLRKAEKTLIDLPTENGHASTVALVGDDVLLDMPDLMENLDVLSSLRGAQELMMDLIEDPDMIKERVDQVTKAYFPIFDAFYEQVKDAEEFLTQLKKLPKQGVEAARLLTIGFMNGLDAAQLAARK